MLKIANHLFNLSVDAFFFVFRKLLLWIYLVCVCVCVRATVFTFLINFATCTYGRDSLVHFDSTDDIDADDNNDGDADGIFRLSGCHLNAPIRRCKIDKRQRRRCHCH